MKTLFIYLFILVIPILTNSEVRGDGELILKVYGIDEEEYYNITFKAELVDPSTFLVDNSATRWDFDNNLVCNAEDYTGDEKQKNGVNLRDPLYIPWYLYWRDCSDCQSLGKGLYKVSVIDDGAETDYFYWDTRTSDSWGNQDPDVAFDYDFDEKDILNVATGGIETLWDNHEAFDHETSGFELYLTLTQHNKHPKLEWNPYHNSNIEGYNVYKRLTASGASTIIVNFTTNTTYIDYSFTIDPKFGDDKAEYWIKAKIDENIESCRGNKSRVVDGNSIIQWKRASNNREKSNKTKFIVKENYPNPFNPVTTIRYTIPSKTNVSIIVYDTFGKKVRELINQFQKKGTHSIKFNAKDLSSGVYYYSINAGKYKKTKKLMLLR